MTKKSLRLLCLAALATLLLSPHGLSVSVAETQTAGNGTSSDMAAEQAIVRLGDLTIEAAWTRQAPPGASVMGGYARISNTGTREDRLIGGSAPFAKRVEVHQMSNTDGVMKMSQVDGGLPIPPGGTVELKPGGFHLMFLGATSPAAGDTVPVTLVFENAGSITINLPVAPIGAPSPPTQQHSH